MRYAVLGGGKRVRPLLAFAAGEITEADAGRVALAGAAVEVIHAYSLGAGDLPGRGAGGLRAAAAGSRGRAGGQAIDLAAVGTSLTLPELEFMHIHKTGALIRAAVLLGAQCGSVSVEQLDRLDHFGKLIGLAFQVVDDVLDCEADTATLGKTAGKDADNDKPTYVSLLGIQGARTMAQQLHREALESLAGFGDAAQRLRELADFIVLRKF